MSEIATTTGDEVVVLDPVPSDPHERARVRLERLTTSFATTLAIVAEMYRDEDWRYLSRADGTPYNSLAEVFSDTMQMSMSMSRRYIQGARDFYLPLSEVMVDGTRIEVTSGDIAALGKDGLADAVETAKSRLGDVEDPGESSGVIAGAVEEAKDRKKKSRDEWDDEDADDAFDSGYVSSGGGREGDLGFSGASALPDPDHDWADDEDADDFEDDRDDTSGNEASGVDLDDLTDPLAKVMGGATTYEDPEVLTSLDEPLRSVVAALVTLSEMDPSDVSKIVTYDTRGALLHVDKALTNITRFRALAETHPWLLSRLT